MAKETSPKMVIKQMVTKVVRKVMVNENGGDVTKVIINEKGGDVTKKTRKVATKTMTDLKLVRSKLPRDFFLIEIGVTNRPPLTCQKLHKLRKKLTSWPGSKALSVRKLITMIWSGPLEF